ncbi:EamA family transporter [Flavobacterium sp.]|uniref:EamA family transporter n=1 Tax=Flavobacterium sp. TaxID=239 RepID=UPI0037BE4F1F
MWFILISILCSVSVGILLKITKRYNLNIAQIIGWNYLTALLLAYFIYQPNLEIPPSNATIYLLLGLSILLPSVFFIQNISIQQVGIVRTDVAQRLSLFIPILAAYFIFDETFSTYKIIGIVIGFSAIVLTLAKKSETQQQNTNWLYPLLVLLGFGIIDTLFKKVASTQQIPFTTALFFIFFGALLVVITVLAFQKIRQNKRIRWENCYWGIGIGILNFGNILFYLKAHKALTDKPTTVFAAMNMGVIVLGSLAGTLLFKEKLSKWNFFGIVLAIVAILFITLSQL